MVSSSNTLDTSGNNDFRIFVKVRRLFGRVVAGAGDRLVKLVLSVEYASALRLSEEMEAKFLRYICIE